MKHTDEQKEIINCRAKNVTVNAFAGTGKTSTLVGYAAARPDQKILYLAFNTSVAQEARERFPKNVDARTSHSLAYGRVGNLYKHKLGNPRPKTVVDMLTPHFTSGQMGDDKYAFAQMALATVNRYFASPGLEKDIPALADDGEYQTANGRSLNPKMLSKAARLIWAAMQDQSNLEIQMPHDGYLKIYQSMEPQLTRYDIILLDEAQDTNSSTLGLVMNQKHCGKVLVGDRYQNIYGFRGAINAMDAVPDATQLALTSSFRFGPAIANTANSILNVFRGERQQIKGLSTNTSRPNDVCFIHRTNADLFGRAVQLHTSNHRIHFSGGIRGYQLDLLTDVWALKTGRRDAIKDNFVRRFYSFSELENYAEQVQDKEIMARIKVVDQFGCDIPRLVKEITDSEVIKDEADASLSTAHKSKGLEWDKVVLGEDFPDMMAGGLPRARPFLAKKSEESPLEPEEANLIYVAATRAKKVLSRYAGLVEFGDWWDERQKDLAQSKPTKNALPV